MTSGSGFSVDPGRLRDVASRLGHTVEFLGTASARVTGAAVPDQAFAAAPASAGAAGAWREALAVFDRRVHQVTAKATKDAKSLVDVAEAYQRADQQVAAAYTRLHQESARSHRGDRGAAVTALQRDLRAAGYDPGPIDGRYGRRTAQAVEQFNRQHPADGSSTD